MKKPANSGPTEKLAAYRAKRSADATAEPFGLATTSRPGLFVVHKHDATRLHYDLRLEMGGVLVSFAIPKGPSANPADKRLAVHVEDHPVEYADFEGIIPEDNYGAGPSIVWDRGAWVEVKDPKHGLEQGKLTFDLHGHKLRGRWSLVRIKDSRKDWLLIKAPDAYASEAPAPYPEASIFSGLNVEDLSAAATRREALGRELAELPLFTTPREKLEPMLAQTAPAPFSREGWLFELKYDGFRMMGGRENGTASLRFRRGGDATASVPELAHALAALPYDYLLDGELVVLDERGHPSFARLQKRIHLTRRLDIERAQVTHPATLFVFDLLVLEGKDLRGLPLLERKRLLRRVLAPVGPVRYCDHVETLGAELYAETRKLGLEGVMAKRADSPYRSGRQDDWQKIRSERAGDFAVVGFTQATSSRTGFGALDLACWDGERFVYAGSVGTGFSDAELKAYRDELNEALRPTPAFDGEPVPGRKHLWVEPRIVVEVGYFEASSDGLLRQPRFLRRRTDKEVRDCAPVAELTLRSQPHQPPAGDADAPRPAVVEPVQRRVVISNPKKIFWPADGYTKADLVAYYRAISPWLLPYLRERPVVLTRYPDGIDGKSFFQKDAPPFVPGWLRTARVWSEQTQREIDYFVCDDEPSLSYVANLATIPLHVWSSRVDRLQAPDFSILDLDPKGAPFAHVVKVARKLRQICEAIGLPSYVKTSGSSGLHILVPLGARTTYAESRQLAEVLSRVVVTALPDISTMERVIAARGGKVYLDYLQNGHGKLIVAPFSARPLPHAPVSMPLLWDEVDEAHHPTRYTIKDAVERMEKLGKDPMLEVLGSGPELTSVLTRLGEKLGELAK